MYFLLNFFCTYFPERDSLENLLYPAQYTNIAEGEAIARPKDEVYRSRNCDVKVNPRTSPMMGRYLLYAGPHRSFSAH